MDDDKPYYKKWWFVNQPKKNGGQGLPGIIISRFGPRSLTEYGTSLAGNYQHDPAVSMLNPQVTFHKNTLLYKGFIYGRQCDNLSYNWVVFYPVVNIYIYICRYSSWNPTARWSFVVTKMHLVILTETWMITGNRFRYNFVSSFRYNIPVCIYVYSIFVYIYIMYI